MESQRKDYESKHKNIYLPRLKNLSVKKFTTNLGLKARRIFMPPVYKINKKMSKYNIVVENYPKLDNDSYIFTPNHGFADDIEVTLSCLDRNAYLLLGSTDQADYNPELYGAFINGMIVMDIMDSEKRKEAFQKMKRVLNAGNSILMFPEGSWNVSENKIINPLYYGPYFLNQETNKKVVPVSLHKMDNEKDIYINFGDPISFDGMTREEGTNYLRDTLATMKFNQIHKYEKPLQRKDLNDNCRLEYLESKLKEVTKSKWGVGNWEAEFLHKETPKEIFDNEYNNILEKINLNYANANIFAKDYVLNKENQKYKFVNYLYDNLTFVRKKK